MSLYEALLAVHVLAAVVWVGSNVANNVLGARRLRNSDPQRMAELARELEWYGSRVLVPTTLLLIASGFGIVAEVDGYELGDLWIALGLAGWIASFILGAAYAGPQLKRFFGEVEAAGNQVTESARTRLQRIVLIARIEVVMLVLIVIDMVLKPGA